MSPPNLIVQIAVGMWERSDDSNFVHQVSPRLVNMLTNRGRLCDVCNFHIV